jgi:DNA-directed RNA polymerase specialized sigma24 family protein
VIRLPNKIEDNVPGRAMKNGSRDLRRSEGSHFDKVVARYYPAVYSFATRLTGDPRDAILLTRKAFANARRQLHALRDQDSITTILLTSVLRAGLARA